MKILYYRSIYVRERHIEDINTIFSYITGDISSEKIEQCELIEDGEIDKYSLPVIYFQVSEIADGVPKSDANARKLSGLVIVDIDKKKNMVLDFHVLKHTLINDPLVYACFFSPSGGLKVLVKTNNKNKAYHNSYYVALKNYFSKHALIDKSGSNPMRACFLCHDKEIYINKRSKIFELTKSQIKPEIKFNDQEGFGESGPQDEKQVSLNERLKRITAKELNIEKLVEVYPAIFNKHRFKNIKELKKEGITNFINKRRIKYFTDVDPIYLKHRKTYKIPEGLECCNLILFNKEKKIKDYRYASGKPRIVLRGTGIYFCRFCQLCGRSSWSRLTLCSGIRERISSNHSIGFT